MLKNTNLFFSNQTLIIKGNNSCQKQCFMEIALLNVKTLYKSCLTFSYCNLIYKLKLIKQNAISCSLFHIKIDIQWQ